MIKEYVQKLKNKKLILPAWYEADKEVVRMLDQTELPEETYLSLTSVEEVAEAIVDMKIRGSGAIALAGIYGIVIAALKSKGNLDRILEARDILHQTRPTAINMHETITSMTSDLDGFTNKELIEKIQERAINIMDKQLNVEIQIGKNGAGLIEDGDNILTICNAGAVAGFGFGGRTLSVFRTAVESGKKIHVYASETRPYLQGSRITAWELKKFGIPVTLITDNMAGALMQKGMIDKVITGSDRLAANGDTANKIGSYMFSLVCKDQNIPFYVSTSKYNIDLDSRSGDDIEIEMRDSSEVLNINGKSIAPDGVKAIYPGFDITPNNYISGIINEENVFTQPYTEKLAKLAKKI